MTRRITPSLRTTILVFSALMLVCSLTGCFDGTTGYLGPYDATLEDAADASKKPDAATDDWPKLDAFDDVPSFDVDLDGNPPLCHDLDRDGHPAVECGGDDCDDTNPRAYPGASEVCDSRGVDEDCDPCTVAGMSVTPGDDGGTTRLEGDDDGDHYVSAGCFNRYEGRTPMGCSSAVQIDGAMRRVSGRDCDDTNANTHPEQTEVCNGRDDNCNGETDEGVQHTYFIDRDGDGFGDRMSAELARMACARPVGFSETADDCDDTAASVNPAAREVCDMATPPVDENCNGARNEGCDCPDGADRACMQPGVCAAGRQRCVAGRWGNCTISPSAEVCNGLDDNCDGTVDNVPPGSCRPTGAECRDGRCQCPVGQVECGGVCRSVGAGCNNGQVGICARSGSIVCEGSSLRCNAPPGFPGTEVCNGLDDDCNGRIDELSGTSCPVRSCYSCGYPGTYGTCVGCVYSNCVAVNFTNTYTGTDSSFRHSCGMASGTSWTCFNPNVMEAIQYGPFRSLPSGRYRAEFYVTGTVIADISTSSGTQILATSGGQSRTAASPPITLEFNVGAGCPVLEFRVLGGTSHTNFVTVIRTIVTRF